MIRLSLEHLAWAVREGVMDVQDGNATMSPDPIATTDARERMCIAYRRQR